MTCVRQVYHGRVMESAPAGSLVFELAPASTSASALASPRPLVIGASDADAGANALLRYEVVESASAALFGVDAATGAVRTLAPLDRETTRSVEFLVRVADAGRPSLASDGAARVRVDIGDVDDSPPRFSQPFYNATVRALDRVFFT